MPRIKVRRRKRIPIAPIPEEKKVEDVDLSSDEPAGFAEAFERVAVEPEKKQVTFE